MPLNRRRFLQSAALGAGSLAIACNAQGSNGGGASDAGGTLPRRRSS